MSWKDCMRDVCKKQAQPMHQVTYWVLFLSCGFTYVMGTVSGAAVASYSLLLQNPEVASTSWLVNGMF